MASEATAVPSKAPCACGAQYTDPENPFDAIHSHACVAPERHWGYCGDMECKGPCPKCGSCTHGQHHDDGCGGTTERDCVKCDYSYWD